MDRDAWEGTDGHARDEDKYFEFEKKWVPIEKKIKEFIKSYKDKNILHGTAEDGGDWDDGCLDYEIPVYEKEDD